MRQTAITTQAMNETNPAARYVYIFACHEDEAELCGMELRTLLGAVASAADPDTGQAQADATAFGAKFAVSRTLVHPSRSPFLKLRIAVEAEAGTLDELALQAPRLDAGEGTFKVVYADTGEYPGDSAGELDYEGKRAIERRIGAAVRGRADMRRPDRLLAVAYAGGRWVLGAAAEGEAVWLRHNRKPQPYSTALGTRVARAVANIAVPDPAGVSAVDPCCGIGTVIIEAQSMGIRMEGFDRNPLAARGARANLEHFGYSPALVKKADMLTLGGRYDAAVLDLPYNLCSKLPEEEELAMLSALGRLAPRAVVVATAPLEGRLEQTGWTVADSCRVRKSSFVRYVYLAKRFNG